MRNSRGTWWSDTVALFLLPLHRTINPCTRTELKSTMSKPSGSNTSGRCLHNGERVWSCASREAEKKYHHIDSKWISTWASPKAIALYKIQLLIPCIPLLRLVIRAWEKWSEKDHVLPEFICVGMKKCSVPRSPPSSKSSFQSFQFLLVNVRLFYILQNAFLSIMFWTINKLNI